jgi:hypothetical protein
MSRFRERLHPEDGVALVTALLAVLIISGLVLVMVSRSIAETRASAGSRDFETAIHAGEAASDLVIRELNRQDGPKDYYSVDAVGTAIEAPEAGVDEKAWALDLHRSGDYEMVDAPTWIEGQNGQAYAVRPVVDASAPNPEPLDVIYAVGAIPSFDADRARIRVLKIQVAQDFFEPNYALLSDHTVTMGGSARFISPGCDYSDPDPDVCIADVHTNKSFTSGGSTRVHGTVSSAGGSCTGDAAALECLDMGVAEQPIPPFSARDFYRPGTEQGDVDWYDLCPDRTIKEGSTGGPCTGEQLWPSDDATGTRYRGWRWRSQGQFDGWSGNPVDPGVFYVYQADARVNGSAGSGQVSATVIVESDPAAPAKTGALEVAGSPKIQPAMKDDVLIITDRDLTIEGGAGASSACADDDAIQFAGFVGVGEQVKMAGNARLHGAMIVQDKDDKHMLVQRGSNNDGFFGTMCLNFNPNLVVDMAGHWVITYWNEL